MYIVTGGAGFIGSALVWKLNELGHEDILVADRMGTQSKWKNLAKRRFSELLHKDALIPWLEQNLSRVNVEGIFHLGASSSTTEMDMDYLVRNNIQASQRLFQLCADYEIPFVYASSASTYGAGEQGFDDDPAKLDDLRVIHPYGFSKHAFDRWALKQTRRPPFWAGLKYFNVYGPQEYHKGSQASVIYHFVPQIKATGQLKLFKSYRPDYAHGEQKRDFVSVKDCVDVTWHMMANAQKAKPGVYNVGSGEARTFTDLGRAVFKAMGVPEPKFEWIEMPEALRGQYQYFTQANLTRLRELAGYRKPMTKLEDGVRDYVAGYLLKDDPYL